MVATDKANRSQPTTVIRFLSVLGPGLVTGAADDDPSGIGTYSQAGAQLGWLDNAPDLPSYGGYPRD